MKRVAFFFVTMFNDGDFVVSGPFATYEDCRLHREGQPPVIYEVVPSALRRRTSSAVSLCYAKEFDYACLDVNLPRPDDCYPMPSRP